MYGTRLPDKEWNGKETKLIIYNGAQKTLTLTNHVIPIQYKFVANEIMPYHKLQFNNSIGNALEKINKQKKKTDSERINETKTTKWEMLMTMRRRSFNYSHKSIIIDLMHRLHFNFAPLSTMLWIRIHWLSENEILWCLHFCVLRRTKPIVWWIWSILAPGQAQNCDSRDWRN